MKRTVTYVITYDYTNLSKKPEALKKYLSPTGETNNGVTCTALSEGDCLNKVNRLVERINNLIDKYNLNEDYEN